VLDASGEVLAASSTAKPPPLTDVSFALPGPNDPAAFGIGLPQTDAVANGPAQTLAVALRLAPGQDRRAAWVVADLPAEALRGAFAKAQPAADTRLLVRRIDGARLAGFLGVTASTPDDAAARSAVGSGRMDLADGTERLVQIERVAHYPIEVVMTRDLDASLARWRELTQISALVMLAVTLAVSALWAGWLRAERARTGAQHALQAEQARAAAAATAAQEGSWDWEPASGDVYLSPRMKELLGHARDRDLAAAGPQAWDAALQSDDRILLGRALDKARSSDEPVDLGVRARHADGRWHWIHIRGRASVAAGGAAQRVAGVASDVTDERENAAQTRRLEAQLARARRLESLGTLAGGVAHDFNNILAVLLGYAEMAARPAPPGSAQARHIEQIVQAAQRGRAMVRRIMAFSGSGIRPCSALWVQPVIEQVLELSAFEPVQRCAGQASSRLQIERRIDRTPLWIRGDATPLFEATMNLCSNARHAMPEGGALTVTVAARSVIGTAWVSHGSLAAGDYVVVSVSDTGAGIAADVMDRLFEPFFTTRGRAGTGLGLAVVHGVVQDFGGVIDVGNNSSNASQPGSIFAMWFPRVEAPAQGVEMGTACADETTPTPPMGQGQTVMVVDDEAALVEMAEEILARFGYEPVGYTDPRAACAALEADPTRFDLIITDEAMPEIRGIELARRARTLRANLPVLLISGYGGIRLMQRAQAAGISQVLMKPLLANDLSAAVASALSSATEAAP
jgi:signal transduction histidine kinase/ActR/RegA family two-component response regulator